MAEMSMNKAIHGAVRRDLRRFVDALAAFPPGDTGRAKQLHTAWSNLADQLRHLQVAGGYRQAGATRRR